MFKTVAALFILFVFPALHFSFDKVPGDNGKAGENIKIGLLIPDSKSLAAIQGAELAVRDANKKGGFKGRNFELVVKTMEGPWGTGSKMAVDLIFEDKVWAILGSHDGRNAHLVEQACTKSRVVFVSSWSSDPTLSQAFVPWFFNCVPNDNQQCNSLIEEIYKTRKISNVCVIADNDYDSKKTLESFLRLIKSRALTDPLQITFDSTGTDIDKVFSKVNKSGCKAIVIFCQPSVSATLLKILRRNRPELAVFTSIASLNEDILEPVELKTFNSYVSVPDYARTDLQKSEFRKEFMKTYNRLPGAVACFAYDGMVVLTEAIKKTGSSEPEVLRKAVYDMHLAGTTGMLLFDEKGNRSGKLKMTSIKDGVPVNWE